MKNSFVTGSIPNAEGVVPVISTNIETKDFLGAVMVRWGINRDNYRVEPGSICSW